MKRWLALILALALAVSLTGCHGRRDTGEEVAAGLFTVPDTFDTAKDYEITFWAKNDTNMTQVNIYKRAIADFEALYPNITVNLRLYTDYGKIYNDVITNIATGTTPNVCITYPDHIATYLTGADTVTALDNLFTDEKYGLGGSELRFDSPTQEEIIPQFLGECRLNGHYYAIPYMRSTEACYVNKTYVEKLGYQLPEVLTWDFVWEVSEAAMAKDAQGNYLVNGQKVLIPFIYKSTDNMMIQMLRQLDAGYSTANGEVRLFNDTTSQLLTTIADHAATGAFNTFKLAGYPANFLNAGQCIFAVDSTAGATWMGSDAPLIDIAEDKLVSFETAVLPIPQFDPEHPQMISQGPSICVFNKTDPQEVLASWLFAQYLLTNDVQIAYSQTEGYVPVTAKAQDSPQYRDYLSRCGEDNDTHYRVKIEAAQLLMANTDNTFVTPVFNGSASLRSAAGQLIENVNKSVRRKQEINDGYLSQLYDEVTALYRLDQIQTTASGEQNLGPLPAASKGLLLGLLACWVVMGVYAAREKFKNRSVGTGKRKEKSVNFSEND
ncbi:MAG: extracellular solute-binding protein [Firmicutes bacterium]|nr:extracellular solute-binding protein [Bacillota bacterium]